MIPLFKEVTEMFDGFHLSSPLTSYQEVNPESESHFRSIVQVLVEGNPQIKKKHKCHPSCLSELFLILKNMCACVWMSPFLDR